MPNSGWPKRALVGPARPEGRRLGVVDRCVEKTALPVGSIRPTMRVTLTVFVVPTLIPPAKAKPRERCDWCGDKFDPDGNCTSCHRPA